MVDHLQHALDHRRPTNSTEAAPGAPDADDGHADPRQGSTGSLSAPDRRGARATPRHEL